MTNIPISGLLDGESIRTRQAEAPFEQDGVTFKGPTRPNPPQQINITNQAQLEDELGPDLIIPDGVALTIVLDDSLTLDKRIMLGLDSILNIHASTSANILTYTGIGALFDNVDSDNPMAELELENLTLVGDLSNTAIEVQGNAMSAVICNNVIFQDFNNVGLIDTGAADFTACSMRNITRGLVFKNQGMIRIDRFSLGQPVTNGMVALAFIPGVTPMGVTIDTFIAVQSAVGNSLFVFDPNSPVGSTYSVINSDSGVSDFYQLGGANIAVTGVVAGQFSNSIRVTTNIAHNFVNGQIVTLSGFLTETTYNATFEVVTTPTAVEFEVRVAFTNTDTGNVNITSSLNQTDPQVLAKDNANQQDSMFIGGWFHSTNAASTTILDGTFSPLNLSTGGGVTAFTENERFSIDDADEGVIQYNGLIAKTVTLIGILGVMKTGSTSNYNLRYAIDRGEIDTVSVVLGGTGYVNAESVTLTGVTSGATNATATISVTAGAITAINIVSGGSQYVEGETVNVIGGSGSGATGTVTLLGFVALPTIIERPQSISTTTRDTILNQEVVLNIGNKIRMEIEGNGTTDSVAIEFGSLDMKG